jgi:hypothetical protein
MPIYQPDGSLFTPTQNVSGRGVEDFAPLTPEEFHQVWQQLEAGLRGGIQDHIPVTIPTGILARLLQTVRVASGASWVEPQRIDLSSIVPPEVLKLPEGSVAFVTDMPNLMDTLREAVNQTTAKSVKAE